MVIVKGILEREDGVLDLPKGNVDDEMCSIHFCMFLPLLRNASTVSVCSRIAFNASLMNNHLVSEGGGIFSLSSMRFFSKTKYSSPACHWL